MSLAMDKGTRTSTSASHLISTLDGSCWKFVSVYSEGIWNEKHGGGGILKHALPRLSLQIAVIFILTSIIHSLLKRHHLPRLVSEVLAGVLLGPSVMGCLWPAASKALFPPQSEKIISALITFGYIFFIFLVAVKMDVSLITKCGRREWNICASLTFNLILVPFIATNLDRTLDKQAFPMEWISFYSGAMVLTSFPVIACFLMHLKMINSELGHLALSTALITDLTSVLLINLHDCINIMKGASLRAGIKAMFLSFMLVAFIMTILRKLMFWIIRRTTEGKPLKNGFIIVIAFFVMLVAIIGDTVGLQYFYGPFIFGLAVPPGPPLASALVEKLDTIVSGLFLPLMATYCGIKANIWELNHFPPYSITFILTLGLLLKLIAAFIPAFFLKMRFRDTVALTLILNVKGIVELGTFATNSHKQSIDAGHFTMAVLTILVVATIMPLAVRKLHDPSTQYPGYQNRNILNCANNEDLGILVCTHRKDDALAAIRVLEVSNPDKGRSLLVIGLYLEAVRGRSTPLLINHQLGQKASSSSGSHQQPIINFFKYFKAEHPRFVQVQVFSAISLPNLMHEDICWIAFDKLVSLILLPFHRKWNANGELISDDHALRILNSKVLNKPPASVGILLDRSNISSPSSIFVSQSIYRVVVFYIGGEDDMEALAFAKRMAGCSRVNLTVLHFTVSNDYGHTGWNKLDDELFYGLEKNHEMLMTHNTMYREQMVRNGDDMAAMIRTMAEKYDLVVVGRRHDSPITSSISEGCELQELGPVGNLLASSEFTNPVSVLVIQKQIIGAK